MSKAKEIVDKVLSMVPIEDMEADDYKETVNACIKEVEKIIDPLGTAIRTREENHHREKLDISDWIDI